MPHEAEAETKVFRLCLSRRSLAVRFLLISSLPQPSSPSLFTRRQALSHGWIGPGHCRTH